MLINVFLARTECAEANLSLYETDVYWKINGSFENKFSFPIHIPIELNLQTKSMETNARFIIYIQGTWKKTTIFICGMNSGRCLSIRPREKGKIMLNLKNIKYIKITTGKHPIFLPVIVKVEIGEEQSWISKPIVITRKGEWYAINVKELRDSNVARAIRGVYDSVNSKIESDCIRVRNELNTRISENDFIALLYFLENEKAETVRKNILKKIISEKLFSEEQYPEEFAPRILSLLRNSHDLCEWEKGVIPILN